MSGLLYRVRGAEIIDFGAHFECNRPPFFMAGSVFQAVDFGALKQQALGSGWDRFKLAAS